MSRNLECEKNHHVTEPSLASLSVAEPGVVAAKPARHFRTIALVIASALFMEQLDATVLVTALPTMAHDLHTSAPSMSSALTAYLLTLAIFIPASGWIADRFGAKRVFLMAMAMFIAGSALCGMAPNLTVLTITRALQGLGGAMMIPVSRLVLLRSVKREEMVSAMSWLLLPALLGPILGPPVGALIMGWLGWRWIFYINLPISLIGAVLIAIFIDDVREPRPKRFDMVGFILSGMGLGCLFLGLESAGHGETWIKFAPLFGVGLTAGCLYVAHARRRSHAILDLTLLRIPTFRLALIAGSLTRVTQGAQPFLLALLLQIGFGLSPLRSGLTMVATSVGAFSMKALAPRLLRRFGFRNGMIVGGVLASAVYAVCGFFRPNWPEVALLAVLLAGGACMAFQFSAYNTIAFDGVDRADSGAAMGFHTTFQQLMLSVGVCTGASALSGAMALQKHAHPALSDFSIAFFVVTAISLSATLWNWRFDPAAGQSFSGHKAPRSTPIEPD